MRAYPSPPCRRVPRGCVWGCPPRRSASPGSGPGLQQCWWCTRCPENKGGRVMETIQLTVHDDMGGRLALWYHIYGSLWTAKNIQTNNLISENILSFHQFNRPPVSSWTVNCFDAYERVMASVRQYNYQMGYPEVKIVFARSQLVLQKKKSFSI